MLAVTPRSGALIVALNNDIFYPFDASSFAIQIHVDAEDVKIKFCLETQLAFDEIRLNHTSYLLYFKAVNIFFRFMRGPFYIANIRNAFYFKEMNRPVSKGHNVQFSPLFPIISSLNAET